MQTPRIFLSSLALIFAILACKSQQSVLTEREKKDAPMATRDSLPSPSLLANVGDSLRPMYLDTLIVRTLIQGPLARTTYEMTFYNPHDRQLEGKFFFPKENEQSLARFALLIDGKWREGVIVPSAKGRTAYEATVRKSVDPALLEYASGNVFKARIFPLPPKGRRKLLIAFDQKLKPYSTKQAAENRSFYEFHSIFNKKIPHVRQEILVDVPDLWSAETSLHHPGIAALKKVPGGLSAVFSKDKHRPDNFEVGIPNDIGSSVAIEEGQGGETWFSASINTSLPLFQKERKKPQKVVIYWDASQQGKVRKIGQELDLLSKLLQSCMSRNFEVELLAFDIAIRQKVRANIQNEEDIQAFISQVKSIPFDGAADFALLDFDQMGVDEYWIFSNGQSPFDKASPSKMPVYAVLSSRKNQNPVFQALTRNSLGQVIDLSTNKMADALEQFFRPALRFQGVEHLEGSIEEVFPLPGTPAANPFVLTGKLLHDQTDIILKFGYGSMTTHRIRASLDKVEQLTSGHLLSRLWAEKKMAHLLENPAENREDILNLGQKHRIVSPQTSMIVLDRLEDYIEYRIPPPNEWAAAYQKAIELKDKKQRASLFTHLNKVAEEFQARKVWWETDFKIPPGKYKAAKTTKSREDSANRVELTGEVPRIGLLDGSMDDLTDEEDVFSSPASSEEEIIRLRQQIKMMGDKEIDLKKNEANGGKIELNKLKLDAAYLDTLKASPPENWEALYFYQKEKYGMLPAFYLDMADYFYENDKKDLALRMVSNLAVLEVANHEAYRILAYRFLQWGQSKNAIVLLKKVLELREEEPQSYRDLGLAYAEAQQYQQAIEWLYEVVRRPWDGRFSGIGVVAAHEINAILARTEEPLATSDIDERFLADLPCDLRVVMSWDANDVDLDLWVIDPREEKCYYQHKLTEIGGMISEDFTNGYGPEEFLIKNAMKGEYLIKVNYYGDSRQSLSGPATLYLKLILDYGRKSQRSRDIILRLEKESEVLDVGSIKVE